ncbi:glycolate oxidase subunit GlcE [Phenylobacterium sp.]|uniref:glycolate oxidase subunit GlcE n=1 Tax=Phenylobacterium sp. TaxID=1871053 RepID=UPI003983A2B5
MLDATACIDTPTSADEVQKLVAEAAAEGRRLEIVGGGTKRGIGGPVRADAVLSLAGLDKLVDYAPEELVLTAQPGIRLADLERLVAAEGQMLPFEPPHLGGLLGEPGEATLGGTLAANLSGPRRVRAGAARDHLLGFEAVNGRGERFKAGGKVVKNVTGYDLSKLMCGSWGTLAVMTEVTIKVLPAPRTEMTLLFFGLDDRRAAQAMGRALNSACEVSGAAHLPTSAAQRPPLGADLAVTAIRLEGFEASVASRLQALVRLLQGLGAIQQLNAAHSAEFWAQVREVDAFAADPRPLWRLSLPPANGWQVPGVIVGDIIQDWGGGLVWLLSDAEPQSLRAAVRALGGHATLYRGDGPAFEPLTGPLAALTARVKAAFDPLDILNPGRMVPA